MDLEEIKNLREIDRTRGYPGLILTDPYRGWEPRWARRAGALVVGAILIVGGFAFDGVTAVGHHAAFIAAGVALSYVWQR
jgi:hypothetical protein